ncbi:MAG: sugar phosphate nucleotidyltransferase [Candidatus Promineifilaceae bacterium]
MKAILLATSESKKLFPLTESMPSPMVPMVNRPVMAYVVEMLARQGVKDIVVSLYHLAGQIESYFGDGRRWGVSLEYALQSQSLGSAGSLKWSQPLLADTFLVLPADVMLDLDISAALAYHESEGNAATVIDSRAAFSAVGHDFPGMVKDVPPLETGAYIFDAKVLDLIPARTAFDIRSELLPAISKAGLGVSCFEMAGYGNLLQSFEDYQDAQKTVLNYHLDWDEQEATRPSLQFFGLNGRQFSEGIWVGRNEVIHPTARLMPPVYIGENCFIGKDVELGPDTVIGSNVVIDDEATVAQSTILDGTYVGQLVNVEHRLVNKSLVVDLETADYMRVTDDFLLGQSYQSNIDWGVRRILDILLVLPVILPIFLFSIPLSLLLWLATGKAFKRVEKQFIRPTSNEESKKVTFQLYQFNAAGRDGSYNGLGRWLTRFDLHRWPELWNLLKGDLTLVGVRPLSAEEIGRLDEQWQQPRHEQRPGLTGLWYTNTRRESDLDESVVADIYYMAMKNWREDLRILWQTPGSWFRRIRS